MNKPWHVCLAGGQFIAWALDEDLHWVKRSLEGRCQWDALPAARIVHAAWPAAVNAIPGGALRGKTVICQADNPPAFYLGIEDFVKAAARVDLWIARTNEACEQFQILGLPVARAPYCVDAAVFRPLPEREQIRASLGIQKDAFVIGNFHRDSEGADLTKPKKQKGADVFFEIAKQLNGRIPNLVVLLAGPRRHWLLRALRTADVNVVFAGKEPGEEDDYEQNIQTRKKLNELYQALNVCVISSRWEGGPYSVLEALSAGVPVISSPVGTSRDVLPMECLFESAQEAVEKLVRHAKTRDLDFICKDAAARTSKSHGADALKESLLEIYRSLPVGRVTFRETLTAAVYCVTDRVVRWRREKSPAMAELFRRVQARAASLHEAPQIINYQDGGSREALLECAAQIAATRKHL